MLNTVETASFVDGLIITICGVGMWHIQWERQWKQQANIYNKKTKVHFTHLVHFQRVRHILKLGSMVVDVLDVDCAGQERVLERERERDEGESNTWTRVER